MSENQPSTPEHKDPTQEVWERAEREAREGQKGDETSTKEEPGEEKAKTTPKK